MSEPNFTFCINQELVTLTARLDKVSHDIDELWNTAQTLRNKHAELASKQLPKDADNHLVMMMAAYNSALLQLGRMAHVREMLQEMVQHLKAYQFQRIVTSKTRMRLPYPWEKT